MTTSTETMRRLDGVDLLVVNAGDPWRGDGDPPAAESITGFADALRRGIGVLGLHAAAATMRDYRWSEAFGAIWLPGLSGHPPIGVTRIALATSQPGGRSGRLRRVRERIRACSGVGSAEVVATTR